MARITSAEKTIRKPCRYRCGLTFQRNKAYDNHIQDKHGQEEEKRLQFEESFRKAQDLERQRQEGIAKRSGLHLGLQAISRSKADDFTMDRDIDDLVEEIQMVVEAQPCPQRSPTPERWKTRRAVEDDDFESEPESRVDPTERMELDNPPPQRILRDTDKTPVYKVTKRIPNENAGHCDKWGSVPLENLRFDLTGKDETRGPWYPFKDAFNFNMARWLSKYRASSAMIREGYNSGLLSQRHSGRHIQFQSTHSLRKLIDMMEPQFAGDKWEAGVATFYSDNKNKFQKYYFRRIPRVIRHYFRQPAFRDYMIYRSEVHYNAKGERVYSDMYTARWWRRMEDKLPLGSTLLPLIFASDGTQLSTHAGDHDLWPIYMSLGNLSASLRSRPSTNSWMLIGLFPIPPKKDDYLGTDNGVPCKATGAESEKYAKFKADVFHQVIGTILYEDMKTMFDNGLQLECADGKIRQGRPVIGAWIADYLEYNKLYQIKKDGCCVCEVTKNQLGDNHIATERNPTEDMTQFVKLRNCTLKLETLKENLAELNTNPSNVTKAELARQRSRINQQVKEWDEQRKVLEVYFNDRQLKAHYNTFWNTPLYSGRNIWKPDILHTLYQGMVRHCLTWLKLFLQHHKRYARWEAAWLRIPAFHGLPTPKRAIGQNKQFGGKLLRNAVKDLLPTLVIALDDATPEEEDEFEKALTCVRYLVDFTLIAQYKYHTKETIDYMQRYLDGFHATKDVFKDFRSTTTARRAAKERAEERKEALISELEERSKLPSTSRRTQDEAMEAPQRAYKRVKLAKTASGTTDNPSTIMPTSSSGNATNNTKKAQAPRTTAKKASQLSKRVAALIAECPDLHDWIKQGLAKAEYLSEKVKAEVSTIEDYIHALALDTELEILSASAHFEFIKIHLLSHFPESIEEFGALEQYSTEIWETLHKGVKEAYRCSNKQNHLDQILRFCTRVYSIRMHELNLIQLAKDGAWRSEIQGVLQLYATAADKRLAAKLNRQGRGSEIVFQLQQQQIIDHDSGYEGEEEFEEDQRTMRKIMVAKEAAALRKARFITNDQQPDSTIPREEQEGQEEPEDELEEDDEEDGLTPEERRICLPPVVPLFSKESLELEALHPLFSKNQGPAKATRWLGGKVKTKKMELADVSALYKLPYLAAAVRKHLLLEDTQYTTYDGTNLNITSTEISSLLTEIHTSISIRCDTVQSAEPFETLKAVCSGPRRIGKSIRNDCVLFRDVDEEAGEDEGGSDVGGDEDEVSELGVAPRSNGIEAEGSRFGPYLFGQLQCLFKLKVPKPEEWRTYRIGNGATLPEDYYRTYRLAYVQVFKPVLQSGGSEMISGPEIAKVNMDTAAHRGLRIMDIKKLVRPARLIPAHEENETDPKKMSWVVNNRIDLGTWDIIYGDD